MNQQSTTAQSALSRKRLTGSEREALVNVNVALDLLMKSQDELKARAKTVPGGNRYIAMVIAKLTKLLGYFAATVPHEQLKTYLNNLNMASITVGVKNPANLGRRTGDEYGMWLSYEAIEQIINGCHDHCLMCALDRGERKRCKLKKAMDSIPNDLSPREDDCPYFGEV